jgi:hypothetical protein
MLPLLAALPVACAGNQDDSSAELRRAFADARAGLLLPGSGAVAGTASEPRPVVDAEGSPAARPAAAAELLGARPDAVRRWLGEPALRRIEGAAEVWLYAGPACALDLVLYPERGGLRVAHAVARASGTEQRAEAACLAELGRRH